MKIRVLLADDHAMTRTAMRSLLQTQRDIEVVGEACNGQLALQMTGEFRPDVVVMDISMPQLNGIDATEQIHRLYPNVRVVAQSGHSSRAYVTAMLKAGATAYILKGHLFSDLVLAVQTVAAGHTYFGTEVDSLVEETCWEPLEM